MLANNIYLPDFPMLLFCKYLLLVSLHFAWRKGKFVMQDNMIALNMYWNLGSMEIIFCFCLKSGLGIL